MKKSVNALFVSALAILFLNGCSQSTSNDKPLLSYIPGYDAIFSNRPQTATDSMIMVKLQSPALLSALKTNKAGKKQADPDLLKAIASEQDAMINTLQTIDPKISVVYRYRMVLNGLALDVPLSDLAQIQKLTNVVYVETVTNFSRPVAPAAEKPADVATSNHSFERNSVKFIGGDEAHALGFTGKGVRVGVIDTGIDYTHAMFGGTGTAEAYKAINPDVANSAFPSAKVVGGIDLVGSAYDSASGDYSRHVPHVDPNPLDEQGHGSHVSGTIAGHGDGINTYDGVAPDAKLYAIKVFGKEGSTGDEAVLAGLEFAADPNSDGDISDQLDVVNLSLGSDYGDPHVLYTEAVQNLSRAGTVVVISAGNSGDQSYVVGAPGVADDALSVAASLDNADVNWKFSAVQFTTPDGTETPEAFEATFTAPIDAKDVSGVLVYVGLANADLTPQVAAQLAGHVALIDRGGEPFADKIKRAVAAGAIGVVIANSEAGDPFTMGADASVHFDIPAVMISQDLAKKLKAEQSKGQVSIAFKTSVKFEKPQLIDTIASFSSKGPRSIDALIKPEITAPGSLVTSAAMGQGQKGVELSGTSMAAPHMTGVMALMKQKFPNLSSLELKSIVMGTARTLFDENKKVYPISRQGAGRVQIMAALNAKLVSLPSALSLGEVTVESRKLLRKQVLFKNISKEDLTLAIEFDSDKGLTLQSDSSLHLAAGASKVLDLAFTVDARSLPKSSDELDGMLTLNLGENELIRVPVLAVVNKVSQLKAQSLVVHSTSLTDSEGAAADLTVTNTGLNNGDAYVFNLIGANQRKVNRFQDPYVQTSCDLQAAGYRVIQKKGVPVVQFAVKVYEPLTTWDNCEVSVLIGGDEDGVADQELVGIKADKDHLPGLNGNDFESVLLDAQAAAQIRKQFELNTLAAGQAKASDPKAPPAIKEDYNPAIIGTSPMLAAENSTVAILEVPVGVLKLRATGELAVKIALSNQDSSALEPDDFLTTSSPDSWISIGVGPRGPAYEGMPETISLTPGQSQNIPLVKGAGDQSLWILYPNNAPVVGGVNLDSQSQTVAPTFEL
jgi:subtilisin family serine protease